MSCSSWPCVFAMRELLGDERPIMLARICTWYSDFRYRIELWVLNDTLPLRSLGTWKLRRAKTTLEVNPSHNWYCMHVYIYKVSFSSKGMPCVNANDHNLS